MAKEKITKRIWRTLFWWLNTKQKQKEEKQEEEEKPRPKKPEDYKKKGIGMRGVEIKHNYGSIPIIFKGRETLTSQSYIETWEGTIKNVHLETFNSIEEMLYVLRKRDNNPIMKGCNASSEMDHEHYRFTGTYSYEEAVELFRKGYTDILKEVKENVRRELVKYKMDNSEKSKVLNDSVGFIPNVPNALMRLPESMIIRKPAPRKVRALHIRYFMEGACSVDKSVFKLAGITLLTALEIIEKRRISIRLDCGFFCSLGRRDYEAIAGMVKLKNYNERFNLQKMCFPLAHPSYFRRFGFKFLETFPKMTDDTFPHGYGRPLRHSELVSNYKTGKDVIVISSMQICNELGYSVNRLIDYINSQCQG